MNLILISLAVLGVTGLVGIHAEDVVLMRIEHNMDKYYYAFNIVNLNDHLKNI